MNWYLLGALLSGIMSGVQGVLVSQASRTGGINLVVLGLSLAQAAFPAVMLLTNRGALPADFRLPLVLSVGAGLMGTVILALNTGAIRHLGAASSFVALTAGLLLASMVVDHMGWSGTLRSAFEPGRALGLILVLAGVWFMSR
jgi:transporter family-2 protein